MKVLPKLVTFDTSHELSGWLNDEASWNVPDRVVTAEVVQPEMSRLNDEAPLKVSRSEVTDETSHDAQGWSKDEALRNVHSKLVTFETSQPASG